MLLYSLCIGAPLMDTSKTIYIPTKFYKFGWNISPNSAELHENLTNINFGEVVYLSYLRFLATFNEWLPL